MARSSGGVRFKGQVLAVVAAIPEGRVTTYGAIGRHLQVTARQVAFILARLTVEESKLLPWFRVVAANGFVSSTKVGAVGRKQIKRLRAEGVAVTTRNRVEDFQAIVWSPGVATSKHSLQRRTSALSKTLSSSVPTTPYGFPPGPYSF